MLVCIPLSPEKNEVKTPVVVNKTSVFICDIVRKRLPKKAQGRLGEDVGRYNRLYMTHEPSDIQTGCKHNNLHYYHAHYHCCILHTYILSVSVCQTGVNHGCGSF